MQGEYTSIRVESADALKKIPNTRQIPAALKITRTAMFPGSAIGWILKSIRGVNMDEKPRQVDTFRDSRRLSIESEMNNNPVLRKNAILDDLKFVEINEPNTARVPTPENKTKTDFGWALEKLWNGYSVARHGWSGSSIWVKLQYPDRNSKMTHPYLYIEYPSGHKSYPDGMKVPWLASQTDLLENDWFVVG
jgi:hypothetical protein